MYETVSLGVGEGGTTATRSPDCLRLSEKLL